MNGRIRNAIVRKGAVLLVIAIVMGAVPPVSYASTTQQKIDEAEREKDDLKDKLDDTKDELDGLKGEHNSLKGQLNNLNAQMTEVSNKLAELEQQIRDKEQEIADTQASLEEARQTESSQYESMKMRIKYMYENNLDSYLDVFFSAESFAEILNLAEYFEKIAAYDRKKLDEYEANRQFIESEEARLQNEKVQLDQLKVQAEAEKSKVAGLISQTSSTISKYADQISDAEQKALEFEAEIKKKEEDLEYLKKKLAEEIAMSRAAANAKWRDISEVTFADGDRYLLANLIYCEAGGEPYAGQLAVGAVVINRVLNSLYPDTVVGVIYQSNQFSPVASGRFDLALASDKATANCYKAADEAMSGMSNVGTCVFFRTPVEGLTGISIGGHIFY